MSIKIVLVKLCLGLSFWVLILVWILVRTFYSNVALKTKVVCEKWKKLLRQENKASAVNGTEAIKYLSMCKLKKNTRNHLWLCHIFLSSLKCSQIKNGIVSFQVLLTLTLIRSPTQLYYWVSDIAHFNTFGDLSVCKSFHA